MKALVLGAGGAASNGFARALQMADWETVGTNRNEDDLLLSVCDRNHLIASVDDYDQWKTDLHRVIDLEKPTIVHAQNDAEVEALARFKTVVHMLGARTFLPSLRSVLTCRDKWESHKAWKAAGIPQPVTFLVDGNRLGVGEGQEGWVRPRVGAGGQKSMRGDVSLLEEWLEAQDGWNGKFTIAGILPGESVTVQRLYWRGELFCSQQRTRASWANAGSTTTGVSGSTGIGVTSSDTEADIIAARAIYAIDKTPHGLWGVDMTRDANGVPNPTEINIGRFFTTSSEFFARAGFNMAAHYAEMCAAQRRVHQLTIVNPLPDGLRWIRGMDREPVLC